MTAPTISRATIVANIAFVQYPDQPDPNIISDAIREVYFTSLNKFRKERSHIGDTSITDGALRGWIYYVPASAPKRLPALRFLRDYFQTVVSPPPKEDAERSALFQAILTFLIEITKEHPDNQKIMSSSDEAKLISSRNINSLHAYSKIDAIKGKYQIIRPYLNEFERYVLEPMVIDIDPANGKPIIYAYSHNQPNAKFLYTGELHLTGRYAFSLLARPHENVEHLLSLRCVSLFANLQQISSEYKTRHCLSGIVMRGVQGNRGLQGPVAIPFIAIKLPNDPLDMSSPWFYRLQSTLCRMTVGGHILIGDVSKDIRGIYPYCSALYSRMINKNRAMSKRRFIRSGIITTLYPEDLQEIVAPNATNPIEYSHGWIDAVEIYYKDWDSRQRHKGHGHS